MKGSLQEDRSIPDDRAEIEVWGSKNGVENVSSIKLALDRVLGDGKNNNRSRNTPGSFKPIQRNRNVGPGEEESPDKLSLN